MQPLLLFCRNNLKINGINLFSLGFFFKNDEDSSENSKLQKKSQNQSIFTFNLIKFVFLVKIAKGLILSHVLIRMKQYRFKAIF